MKKIQHSHGNSSRRVFLGVFLAVGLLVILFFAAEYYCRKSFCTGAKTTPNPYAHSLYSHNGRRISKSHGPLKLMFAPFTIIKNLPNQKTDFFTVNASGFRGKELFRDPDGKIRVIVAGGSAAFGVGAKGDEETFESVLEGLDPRYEIINAGVLGFNTAQELIYIVTELIDYNPDLIIAYHGWNDLYPAWNSWYRWHETDLFEYPSHFLEMEEQFMENFLIQNHFLKGLGRLLDSIGDKSVLVQKIQKKMAPLKLSKYQDQPFPTERIQDEMDLTAIVSRYAENVDKMRDFCRALGIPFLAVFQPSKKHLPDYHPADSAPTKFLDGMTQKYWSEFPVLYARFLEEAKNILSEKEIPFLDIHSSEEFQDDDASLFADRIHTSKEGNILIARIIKKYLDTVFPRETESH